MLPKNLPAINSKSLNQCFACGQDNPIGLKLKFSWDGKTATAEFTPTEFHQGWQGVLHGGIISTILDEAMSYVAYFQGIDTITAKSEVRFKQPVPTQKPLLISATTAKRTRKLLETRATLSLKDGTEVAEGNAILYVFHQDPSPHAVIWDMDGIIANTAPFHFQAWRETFRQKGIEFTEEDFKHSFGLRNDSIIRSIMGSKVSDEDIKTIAQGKEANFRRQLPRHISPLPGVTGLLKSLKEAGFKIALASSTPKENLNLLTRNLGIDKYFDAVVSEEDVTEGKPSPQPFLLAAERLRVPPSNCVVIEDAIAGVQATKAARMKCIAVTNTHSRESLSQADLVIDSLEQVELSTIENLIQNQKIQEGV